MAYALTMITLLNVHKSLSGMLRFNRECATGWKDAYCLQLFCFEMEIWYVSANDI